MSLVFMFPGQSSRYPGMLHKIAAIDDGGWELVEEASDLLGQDLKQHYREDNPDAYGCNKDVQIGVFLANHLFLRLLGKAGIAAEASLGLSLGEWNHLVHIGVVSFRDALQAVWQRGAAYDDGPRGAMASVFPIELEELQAVAQKVSAKTGVVEVVNLNSPRQHVLSGKAEAIDHAVRILDDEYYVQAVIIERDVPMHSSVFVPVGARFAEYLERVHFSSPTLPYLPNRLAQWLTEPDSKQFIELLSTHVYQPVLWRKSIDLVMQRWPDATLVEVGPKAVLYNLLDRKWHRGVRKFHTDSNEAKSKLDKTEHLAAVIAELKK